jgi:hypothetical protein
MSDDTFGFGGAGKGALADKLTKFKPTAAEAPEPAPDLGAIDAAAGRVGFHSREPAAAPTLRRTKTVLGPTVQLNTRAPEDVAARFIQFCDQHRYAYWEGIKALMDKAGIE